MSLCLLRRSSSIASKFRWSGDLRFRIHSTIPNNPPSAVRMPAIMGDYFLENRDKNSTMRPSVRSGSSPGINAATAATAAKSAVTAPRAPSQSILSSWGMSVSMPLAGCQKPSRRLISSHAVLTTAPDTSATSHRRVLIVWASRSIEVSRPWYSPRLAWDRSSKSRMTDWRVSILATEILTSDRRSLSSATWSVLILFQHLPQSAPIPRRPYLSSVR